MSIDYDKLTDQIMDGMKTTKSDGFSSNILKTEIGDSVLGRFVLYKPNPKQSVYHYFHHGWMTSGGKYVSYLCPTTNQETCPMCKRSIQMWKSDDPFLKNASKKIRRKENFIANFHVIENSKNPDLNGQTKLFRFGKQIKTILDDAVEGEDKEIFGKNIWRLDAKGCNFRINVKPNSDAKDAWPSYTSSKFLPPSDLGLSDDEVMSIIDNPIDHTKIFDKQLTYEELTLELQKYYIDDLQQGEDDDEDFTLNGMKKTPVKEPKASAPEAVSSGGNKEIDDILDEIDTEDGADSSKKEEEKSSAEAQIDDLLNDL